MKVKKVLRYYAECGRGFWKKQDAIKHEANCKCWTNPKLKTCKTCKHEKTYYDSSDYESGYLGEGFIRECAIGIDPDGPAWTKPHENIHDLNIHCAWWEINK